ncbi:hypothetical protein Q4485_15250 [Granulosicoccaceae sp. 1_MG-2023]|nr:hypothetical protein [Granulosicoccaceae sp. 1_MG-2023]
MLHTAAGETIDGATAAPAGGTLILAGHAGSTLWPVFSQSPEYHDRRPDPLDRWSRRIGKHIAAACGAQAVFPFDGPPWSPFLSWVQRAGTTFSSPIGLSIDPHAGLWHALRFALWFDRTLPLPEAQASTPPCQQCRSRACLSACPVGAFTGTEYRVEDCTDYLRRHPDSACMQRGCLARHGCPVGQNHAYQPAHAAFHMQAFLRSQTGHD